MWSQFWWVIFPYVMLTLFFIGHVYRYNTDQLGWTAKSSEFLEKKYLRLGSILFHVGIMLVLGGHIFGLLVPKSFTEWMGITEAMYHLSAVVIGSFSGLLTFVGISILLFRRVSIKRVRVTSSFTDFLIAFFLFAEIALGLFNTFVLNVVGTGSNHFDYRLTLGLWLRGILLFTPDVTYMQEVPLVFKLHTLLAFAIFGLWPFTRLVHVWSVPLEYIKRSAILYRRR